MTGAGPATARSWPPPLLPLFEEFRMALRARDIRWAEDSYEVPGVNDKHAPVRRPLHARGDREEWIIGPAPHNLIRRRGAGGHGRP